MSESQPLACVVVEPRAAEATASVIWLHGLGADGHDFEAIVPELGLDSSLAVRFVFPHAPAIPVSINQGMVMPAWYDIREIDLGREHDCVGVQRSAAQVRDLITREAQRGIAPERIVLAGFSQGGALALYEGMRHPHRLAGIMALSCYLVCSDALENERAVPNTTTPVFQAHGEFDPMVPMVRGVEARDRLLKLGQPVQWHSYPMQHQVCAQEITDVGRWLESVLLEK